MPTNSSRPVLLVVLLALVSLVGYFLRTNIGVAQEFMAPQLGLSFNDMGVISAWGFQLAYALFQIPTGFLGDRYGSRIVLAVAILGWALASFATGLVPAVAGTAFMSLFTARFALGVAQAATYPVGSMAIAQAVPLGYRTSANSVFIAGGLVGAAFAPLALAPLMVAFGWRTVFVASGVLGLIMALAWYFFAPVPTRGPSTGPALGEQLRASFSLLGNRDIMLVSVSYLMLSAVWFVFIFWFFRYLVDGRGFSVLASGMWGSVPYFVSLLISPFGGVLADRLARQRPAGRSRRLIAMTGLFLAALLVAVGANLANPYLAIIALALAVACINACEGPFWATVTSLGGSSPGAAGGVLNFMGNLGGVISIWAVPRMRDAFGWTAMLGIWAAVAVLAALLWLVVRVEREEPTQVGTA